MKRRIRVLGSTVGLFCTVAQLYVSPARAEDASAAETAAARALAVDGLKLAQAGDCAGALPKLERAEKLYHSAVVASRLGECYVSVGRLVEGTEILRKTLREPQPAEVTPAYTKALDRAQRVLDTAKPRIAGLTIKVANVQDLSVKIDGAAVPGALVDAEIPTDPGEHVVDIMAPGFLKSATHLALSEGEKRTITVTLARDPNAILAPTAAAQAGVPAAAPTRDNPPQQSAMASDAAAPTERPANHTAAYVSLGIGAAGVITGGVLGILTMQQHKDLQDQCPAGVCPNDRREDLSSAKRLGNVSTIAFGVGGAGLVLGTVLFFATGQGGAADHAKSAERTRFAGLSKPRVAVGPTAVELSADF